jgi:hypothetical protein
MSFRTLKDDSAVVICGMVLKKPSRMPGFQSRVDWEQKIVDAIREY